MTLKEKFKDITTDAITYKQQEDSFMLITDEFAIGFAEWAYRNEYNIGFYFNSSNTKELLEIYKKEKGL